MQNDLFREYIENFINEKYREDFLAWFNDRLPETQELIQRFPPGTEIRDPAGVSRFVINYKEYEDHRPPALMISLVDPTKFPQLAEETMYVQDLSEFGKMEQIPKES